MKILKIFLLVVLLIVVSIFLTIKVLSEPLPSGGPSKEADQMARMMMESLHVDAWKNTNSISWTFKGIHDYNWDISNHEVVVQWDDYVINLHPNDASGTLSQPKEGIVPEEKNELIKQSWDYFNNDSFWLCAPFKAFDNGTQRSIVTLEDGRKGLMITYTGGGSTPGDSYVWILGEDNKPSSIKMWVSILPIGGIEFTWENYKQIESGALIAQDHWLYGKVNIELTDVR